MSAAIRSQQANRNEPQRLQLVDNRRTSRLRSRSSGHRGRLGRRLLGLDFGWGRLNFRDGLTGFRWLHRCRRWRCGRRRGRCGRSALQACQLRVAKFQQASRFGQLGFKARDTITQRLVLRTGSRARITARSRWRNQPQARIRVGAADSAA